MAVSTTQTAGALAFESIEHREQIAIEIPLLRRLQRCRVGAGLVE